jgi:pimeloyl-ACP methyl ester carboxylesterase
VNSRFTLALVHGNGGGGYRFERMRPFVPDEIRFEPLTLPGFGGVRARPMPASMLQFAEALRNRLLGLPGPRVVLGHGIGGSIVLEMLRRFPDAADAVILHAPVGADLDRRLFPWVMRPRWVRELGKRAFAARLLRPMWRRLLFRGDAPAAYLDRFFEDYARCDSFSTMFDILTPEWFASLRPVETPGFLLWGGKERVLKQEQAERFAPLLPRCKTHLVSGWDHFPMIDAPAEYARVVLSLCEEALERCAAR